MADEREPFGLERLKQVQRKDNYPDEQQEEEHDIDIEIHDVSDMSASELKAYIKENGLVVADIPVDDDDEEEEEDDE